MDSRSLAEAIRLFLQPFLPALLRAREQGPEAGRPPGQIEDHSKAWAIWRLLSPELAARQNGREAVEDAVSNPRDSDFQVVWRVRIQKTLEKNPSIWRDILQSAPELGKEPTLKSTEDSLYLRDSLAGPDLICEAPAEAYSSRPHPALGSIEEDPMTDLIGSIDAEPVEDIDEVIYRQ